MSLFMPFSICAIYCTLSPPDSYVDWGAVHFYTPLNRTGEQILTDEEKSNS